MDGFFFLIMFTGSWNELVRVYLGELCLHIATSESKFYSLLFLMIPQAIFCYSVMLSSLFCCALSSCTRKEMALDLSSLEMVALLETPTGFAFFHVYENLCKGPKVCIHPFQTALAGQSL